MIVDLRMVDCNVTPMDMTRRRDWGVVFWWPSGSSHDIIISTITFHLPPSYPLKFRVFFKDAHWEVCILQHGGGDEAVEEVWCMWVSFVSPQGHPPFRPPTHELCLSLGASLTACVISSSRKPACRMTVFSRRNVRSYLGN